MTNKSKHGRLPMDLVCKILKNLTVRTLTRFKCVSKSWFSVISDPQFHKDHYGHHTQRDPFLLITTDEIDEASRTTTLHLSTYSGIGGTRIHKFSANLPLVETDVCPIQSCQGLVCFTDIVQRHIIICNPSTREIITQPMSESDEFTHCIGFGYADSRKEFKVVRLFSGNDFSEGKRNCCEVFTLGTSGWRKSKCPPPEYRTTYWNYNAPFVHSAIHFLPEKHIGDASLNGIDVFNLETEEFTKIPLPENYNTVEENPAFRFMNLQELGGSLYLIFNFRTVVELWTLRDCSTTGMWMKAHTIDLISVSSALVVGGPLPGDGSILLNAFPETDLLYNCNSRETKIIQRAEENSDMLNVFYVESFVSLGTRE